MTDQAVTDEGTDDLLARAKLFTSSTHPPHYRVPVALVADLAAEVERLRPVVDAAVAWADVWATGSVGDDERRVLLAAVDRLQNKTRETTG